MFNDKSKITMKILKKSLWVFTFVMIILQFMSCDKDIKSTQNTRTSFAIVVDSITYHKVESQIISYKKMLEEDGLEVKVLAEQWRKPDDIRKRLEDLYNSKPKLEGAVFIGDVPIPMIMDAQHLSTAYKRDQESFPLHVSAVPSDRYYDDFDLEFEFMEADTARPLNYYYKLTKESPQYVNSNIYTARIKPSTTDDEEKYQLIGNYLDNVVELREKDYDLSNILSYTGHGYNSESLTSWAGEKVTLHEQLPAVFTGDGEAEFLEFRMDDFMKHYLLSKMQDHDLDMALLHDHGAPEMQYLSGNPHVNSVNESIANVKRYLRNKLRAAERGGNDLEETKQRYIEHFDVPYKWFEGTFDDEYVEKDSVFNRNLDIFIDDIQQITPKAKFIMFDACFNGAFNHDEYVAGEYVFGGGKTIVAHANTVNALQDKWPNELIGLLGVGVRFGNWAKQINTLETHLFGDPTFHFKNSFDDIDYNKVIASANLDSKLWDKVLEIDNPDIQAMALKNMFQSDNQQYSDQLRKIYEKSSYMVVRKQCLELLRRLNDENYQNVLVQAVKDPYELIRRKAAYYIGKSGDDELIPAVLEIPYDDKYSRRVVYGAYNSIDLMNPEIILEHIETISDKFSHYLKSEKLTEKIKNRVERNDKKIKKGFEYMASDTVPNKYKKIEIRTLRNYNYHHMIPEYLTLIDNPDFDEDLKIMLVEALGWFTHSYQKDKIEEACKKIMNDDSYGKDLQYEAERTLHRLNPYVEYN